MTSAECLSNAHEWTKLSDNLAYCCGILMRDGLVMVADTRTNAGLDNISTFRKLHIFEKKGERVLMLACAGNLSVTQGVINFLTDGFDNPETGETEKFMLASNMVQAAQIVGRAVRLSRAQANGSAQQAEGINFDVSLLLGGQIGTAAPRLFMIYSAGNSIECTPDTNYLQIGLISMDSTIRSNLSVGLPIDIAVLRRDALSLELSTRIDASDEYFRDLRSRWSKALKEAHMSIPAPPYRDKIL